MSIRDNPYDFILNFYESMYPHMGKRVMSVLSLVPVSLILPPLTNTNGKITTSRINYLLLAPPSSGKTSLAQHFEKFSYNPLSFEYITDSKMFFVLIKKKKVTLITSDIARVFRDTYLSKQIENIIGDEGKLSRLTQRTGEVEYKIDAVGYFAGTPQNISSTITDGIIFRVYPEIVFPTAKEHEDVLKKLNEQMCGDNQQKGDIEGEIVTYYKELLQIQEGEHPEIKKVNAVSIPLYFKEEIAKKILPLFGSHFNDTDTPFYRELNQCYRYMFSHAFLNIFHIKVIDGTIILEDRDLRIAMDLSEKEVKTKTDIIKSIKDISESRLKTLKGLTWWVNEEMKKGKEVTRRRYNIMKTIIMSRN